MFQLWRFTFAQHATYTLKLIHAVHVGPFTTFTLSREDHFVQIVPQTSHFKNTPNLKQLTNVDLK